MRKRDILWSLVAWISLIACYLVIAWWLRNTDVFADANDYVKTLGASSWGKVIFVLLLALGLMLPLSSGTILVLLGVDLFGPSTAFWLSVTGGLLAAVASYSCGRGLYAAFPRLISNGKIARALEVLATRDITLWLLVLGLRAVPNPLYDVWGYAAGLLRMNFVYYITASLLGGMIPVSILCFLVPRAH